MTERDQPAEPKDESGDVALSHVSPEDKLRLIADTVDGQAPFGTELANFRRRLHLILNL